MSGFADLTPRKVIWLMFYMSYIYIHFVFVKIYLLVLKKGGNGCIGLLKINRASDCASFVRIKKKPMIL